MRHVNDLGPTQFRTGAENDKEQVCYYNCNKKDRAFDRFLSVRIQTSTDAIIFSIVNLIDKSNDYKDIYYKVGDELREFNNVSIQPDFFQDNNTIKRKNVGKQCTTTHIKSRNFLSNISYVGISKEEFYNENCVFDIYSLITKNLHLFSLVRKLSNQNKHEMIYMLWKECMPCDFYKHICSEQNFLYLNGKNVLYPKVTEIINEFLDADEKNYVQLRNNLSQFKNVFQCVYSNVYLEVY